jgi:hypothetical protein
VADVAIASVLILTVGALTLLLLRVAPGQSRRRTRALVGLVPGLLGALVVGSLTTDIVPDTWENVAVPWVIVLGTAAVVLLTVTNLAER